MGGNAEKSSAIYHMDEEKEVWSRLHKRLKLRRTSFVAVSLPELFVCKTGYEPKKGRLI